MANDETITRSSTSTNKTHHVAVFAFPFGTHGTPLLNMTRRLASLGEPPQRTTIHFSFFTTLQSLNSLFPGGSGTTDQEFPNIRCFEMWDGKPEGYVAKGNILEEIDLFLKAAKALGALKMAVAAAEAEVREKVTCVMGDAFLWFLGGLAHEIGVPWVSCWISGEHSLSVHVYTDAIRQRFSTSLGTDEGQEEEALDFIPGLSMIRIKDIPEGVVKGNLDSPTAQMLHQMAKVIPNAAAVCIACCEELDPVVTNDLKSHFSKVFTLGPLNLIMPPPQAPHDAHMCLTWLHKQKPRSVVYVSFGSAATPTPVELVALAEALEAGGHHFLWSLKDHIKVNLPSGFIERNKENGMVVPWVPQIEVLAHEGVAVFITHFGYNSMTESIVAEVPMIGRPFFGDHSLNGRLIEAVWEIGLQVQEGVFTKDGVLKSLERVLHGKEGNEMRTNIKKLKGLIEAAVASDGSSIKNFNNLLEFITTY